MRTPLETSLRHLLSVSNARKIIEASEKVKNVYLSDEQITLYDETKEGLEGMMELCENQIMRIDYLTKLNQELMDAQINLILKMNNKL